MADPDGYQQLVIKTKFKVLALEIDTGRRHLYCECRVCPLLDIDFVCLESLT